MYVGMRTTDIRTFEYLIVHFSHILGFPMPTDISVDVSRVGAPMLNYWDGSVRWISSTPERFIDVPGEFYSRTTRLGQRNYAPTFIMRLMKIDGCYGGLSIHEEEVFPVETDEMDE